MSAQDGGAPLDGQPHTDPMKTIGTVGVKSPAPAAAIPPHADGPIRPAPNVGSVSSHTGSAIGVPSPSVRFTVTIPRIAMSTTLLGYLKYGLDAVRWIALMLGINIGDGGTLTLPDPGSQWYVYAVVAVASILRMILGASQSKAMADAPAKA